MDLCFSYRTIRQSHVSNTLAFSPAAPAVNPSKSRQLADCAADREGLDLGDIAENLKKQAVGILAEPIWEWSKTR